MNRRLAAPAVMVFAFACASGTRDREEQVVLRARLTPAMGAAQTWSFTVKQSGNHDVALEFPEPVKDQYAASLVERGIVSVADKGQLPPEFDFTWQILEGPKEIAAGAGRDGFRSHTKNVLVFGGFPATPGVTYRLRVFLSARFVSLLRAAPAVVIEPHS